MLDWNDLRYFLAVADHGSTLAAGRALRVSQTTVARRIAALEEALGHPLFERRQAGYVLTPDGEALLDRARQVEAAASGFDRGLGSAGPRLQWDGTHHHPGDFCAIPCWHRCCASCTSAIPRS